MGRRKENPAPAEKRYPRGIAGVTVRGDRSLMVWSAPGFEPGGVHKLEWRNHSGEVVVSVMTDPGTYRFNNWDNSQSGEPSTWREVERLPVVGAANADHTMTEYARRTLGAVEFI